MGSGVNFTVHIKNTADRSASALSRLMPNIGGPQASKRKLYGHVVQLVMRYAASVWVEALKKQVNRKRLPAVQRRAVLRICSAYRTVSEDAVLVVTGLLSIDLVMLAHEQ